ncbi:MAG: hypothetical protein AAGI25_14610 [Bacteroidota bacterium]
MTATGMAVLPLFGLANDLPDQNNESLYLIGLQDGYSLRPVNYVFEIPSISI